MPAADSGRSHRERFYPESRFGGFTDIDGTIAFYSRVQALLEDGMSVLDVGCGRGACGEDPVSLRRNLRVLKGRAGWAVGLDVDPAAAANPFVHEFRLLEGGEWPVSEGASDLVVADCVLEHIPDPPAFFRSARQALKNGGFLCLRTANAWSYIALTARLVPDRHHARVLARVQEHRKAEDVFPTVYRCNSVSKLRRALLAHGFDGVAYGYEAEPSYLEFSALAYALGVVHQKFAPRLFRPALFAFARASKKPGVEV